MIRYVKTTLIGGPRDGQVISIMEGVNTVEIVRQISSADMHVSLPGAEEPSARESLPTDIYELHRLRIRDEDVSVYVFLGADLEGELRRVGLLR